MLGDHLIAVRGVRSSGSFGRGHAGGRDWGRTRCLGEQASERYIGRGKVFLHERGRNREHLDLIRVPMTLAFIDDANGIASVDVDSQEIAERTVVFGTRQPAEQCRSWIELLGVRRFHFTIQPRDEPCPLIPGWLTRRLGWHFATFDRSDQFAPNRDGLTSDHVIRNTREIDRTVRIRGTVAFHAVSFEQRSDAVGEGHDGRELRLDGRSLLRRSRPWLLHGSRAWGRRRRFRR